MSKRLAILQSSYIPWRGVFDFIDQVDEFVIYDDVQYVKRHWHNRNVIKTANGPLWLSIPVETKGKYLQTIDETRIAAPWANAHWRSIEHAYRKAPCFAEHGPTVAELYRRAEALELLTDVNLLFTAGLCGILGIDTPLVPSSHYPAEGQKTDRLLSICLAAEADAYLSGPSASAYIEPVKFQDAGITLEWMNYSPYRPYLQLHGEFMMGVSILDMIFNLGADVSIERIRAER